MKSFEVVKLTDDAPFTVQAIMKWDSPNNFKDATGDRDIMDDITNFSDKQPIFMVGEAP